MNELIPLVLRALQLLFAIILLGINAYLVSNTYYSSPSQINFMLFNSIWTLFPALPYLALGPRFLPLSANNKIIHLAIDALTALFWFAGFIALAVWYNDRDYCLGTVCGTIVASCVFGAFEWLLFTATTILSALDFWRTRGTSSAPKTVPETTTV
ncbi:MAG: hypothetical protein LQ343_007446 [Gyalolechia ehrenbergii]|nr:MAG: hypothetical protein LQ343_007446 [Gyalolechia ehrenbergii]